MAARRPRRDRVTTAVVAYLDARDVAKDRWEKLSELTEKITGIDLPEYETATPVEVHSAQGHVVGSLMGWRTHGVSVASGTVPVIGALFTVGNAITKIRNGEVPVEEVTTLIGEGAGATIAFGTTISGSRSRQKVRQGLPDPTSPARTARRVSNRLWVASLVDVAVGLGMAALSKNPEMALVGREMTFAGIMPSFVGFASKVRPEKEQQFEAWCRATGEYAKAEAMASRRLSAVGRLSGQDPSEVIRDAVARTPQLQSNADLPDTSLDGPEL